MRGHRLVGENTGIRHVFSRTRAGHFRGRGRVSEAPGGVVNLVAVKQSGLGFGTANGYPGAVAQGEDAAGPASSRVHERGVRLILVALLRL